jgi:hypothetical protein
MDLCEPPSNNTKYRRVIQTAMRRSEEGSITLRIAALTFRGRRAGPTDVVRLIERESDPWVRSILISRLFAHDKAPYRLGQCLHLLEADASSPDEDLACFAGYLRVVEWIESEMPWQVPNTVNRSVKLLLVGMGLRQRSPSKTSVVDKFFESKGINVRFSWRKALGGSFADAERRCVRLQRLLVSDSTARVMMLDTFNELLIQCFSQAHPNLTVHYAKAAGKNPHPDFGAWLRHSALLKVLHTSAPWFQKVHEVRVRADLAHAKSKGGHHRGRPTRPVSFSEATRLLNGAIAPWRELVRSWARCV